MDEWVRLEPGEYHVERAVVVAPGRSAVGLFEPYMEVFNDPGGRRRLVVRALAYSLHLVALMEESDQLDVLLDLGSRFTYRLRRPLISAGKIFSPGVRSAIQITPDAPWKPLGREDFDERIRRLAFVEEDTGT